MSAEIVDLATVRLRRMARSGKPGAEPIEIFDAHRAARAIDWHNIAPAFAYMIERADAPAGAA